MIFYAHYLRAGFIVGVIYTNKLGFKKFSRCPDESSAQIVQILSSFIEMVVGYFDNQNNFNEDTLITFFRKFVSGALTQKLIRHNRKIRSSDSRDQTAHSPINATYHTFDPTLMLLLYKIQ